MAEKKQTGKIVFNSAKAREGFTYMFKATTDTMERLAHRCGWPYVFNQEGKFYPVPLEDLDLVKKVLSKWLVPFQDMDNVQGNVVQEKK
jgi:hypothetical protein